MKRRKAKMVKKAITLTTTAAIMPAGLLGAVMGASGLVGSHFGGELIPVIVGGDPPATSIVDGSVPVAPEPPFAPPAAPVAPAPGDTACLMPKLSPRGLVLVFGLSRNSSCSSAGFEVDEGEEAALDADDDDEAPLLLAFDEVVDDAAAAGLGATAAAAAGSGFELAF